MDAHRREGVHVHVAGHVKVDGKLNDNDSHSDAHPIASSPPSDSDPLFPSASQNVNAERQSVRNTSSTDEAVAARRIHVSSCVASLHPMTRVRVASFTAI